MENRSYQPSPTVEGDLAARFHSAHQLTRESQSVAPEVPPEVLEAVAGKLPAFAQEQLQRQASELAEQLERQHRELEGREARLNAQAAIHDAEVRSTRLWLREQHHLLTEEVAACQRRREELDRRATELAATGTTADRLQTLANTLDDRQHALEQREQDLDRRCRQWGEEVTIWERRRDGTEMALRSQAAALEQQRRDLQSAHAATAALHGQLRQELDAQRDARLALTTQQQRVAALQTQMERVRAGLQQLAQAYEAQRHTGEQAQALVRDRTRHQRARIARRWQHRLQTLRQQEAELQQRRDQADQRQQALDQRETRLEKEELALIGQRLALLPPTDSREPAPARQRAALERAASDYLDRQLRELEMIRSQHRQELQDLADALTREHETTLQRHEVLYRWTDRRQRELDVRTSRLADRERDLADRHTQFQLEQQRWTDSLDRTLGASLTHSSLSPGQDACGS